MQTQQHPCTTTKHTGVAKAHQLKQSCGLKNINNAQRPRPASPNHTAAARLQINKRQNKARSESSPSRTRTDVDAVPPPTWMQCHRASPKLTETTQRHARPTPRRPPHCPVQRTRARASDPSPSNTIATKPRLPPNRDRHHSLAQSNPETRRT